ncbi:cell adhesion molecule 3 [Ahaetulla prasina]|uniref:cell adhesion molecule 3 n=1 Tax=Ahaetulla prasina TaxID=499056 RepID=UPI002649BF87|nr:cell adhesion molecule 3 [Ahaetulla prasina]
MLPLWLLVSSGLIAASRGNLSHDRSQPVTSDEVVVAGSKVVLSCKVEDPEDSSLQWSNPAQQTLYFGEKRALRDLRIQLENSTANELSISIDNTTLADEGEYTCTIFTRPVRTAKAMVTVLGIPQKPQISGYSGPLREGDVAVLTCLSSGSKPAAQLRWNKGEKLLTGQPLEVSKDANGKTFTVTSQVEITVGKEDDGANVTCTVDHSSLQISEKSALQRLSVFYKPTAKIEPKPEHPQEGDSLVLHCKGEGNPIPQDYKWEKDGVDAPLLDAQDNILAFPNLNKSDSGTYICYASNLVGNSIARYTLSVSDASPMTPQRSSYHAIVGGVVAFVIFFLLILLIVLGHYLIRHKGTYLTHEAKGSDDAPDADTAIINAEGGQPGGDDKKEYFI